MTADELARIRAALEAATPGKWEWRGIVEVSYLDKSAIAPNDLRVQTPTPDKDWDAEISFVLQGMKPGYMLVSKADAELIANAPDWLRALLAERERYAAVVEAAREWTRINRDAENVSQDEAILICNRLQDATERWMNDKLAATLGKGE